MIKDPLTIWETPFPYDVLAPAGVTPEFSHSAIKNDVAFELMTQGLMDARTQRAWDELHSIPQRLLVDLMLYQVDPADDIDAAREEVEHELRHPGEPAEVAEALDDTPALVAELAGELEDELGEIVGESLPEEPCATGFDDLGWPGVLDQLIRFDR
ncbi:MAG: hypothetical protein ACRDRV_00605 [Pseudonocardiaceae bacterium]